MLYFGSITDALKVEHGRADSVVELPRLFWGGGSRTVLWDGVGKPRLGSKPSCVLERRCHLPTSLPTTVTPRSGASPRVPVPIAPSPRQQSLAPNGSPRASLPPPSPKLSALGFTAELSSVSVVPGCQRLYISALFMLILCNHFLLQNLLAAR